MYVVVQRVVSRATRLTGINAFVYLHPGLLWDVPPADIPGVDPGQLERESVEIPPNDNVVRSNLEVVAPDDMELLTLRDHMLTFFDRHAAAPLPWKGIQGPCSFHLHMVPQILQGGWSPEAQALAAAGAKLVEDAREARRRRAWSKR